MTKQEIFDIIYDGMAGQGFRQSVKGFDCRYRQKRKNLKCVAGFLIPDSEYNGRKMEGKTVSELDFFKNFDHIDFIIEAQDIHDESMMVEEMKWRLIQLGLRHKLKVKDYNEKDNLDVTSRYTAARLGLPR